jgi:hypothetical protein
MKFRSVGSVIAVATLCVSLAGTASALTLADLMAGATFDSLDGSLSFSGFQVAVSPVLEPDLSSYTVEALASGLRVLGPIGVSDGNAGSLQLDYTVAANNGLFMDGADVFFSGAAFMSDAMSSLDETLNGGTELNLMVTGSGTSIKYASTVFAPISGFDVSTLVGVDSGTGVAAVVTTIDQNFSVVPEPGTATLLGFGLLCMGLHRSRSEG